MYSLALLEGDEPDIIDGESFTITKAFYRRRKVLVCDYNLGWENPRWALWTFESDVRGILLIDGSLWIYGNTGMFKEEDLNDQREEFSGLLPIEFEIGPLIQDENHYTHQPTIIDNLKISSGFFSVRQFDRAAAERIITLGATSNKRRIIHYATVRKGVYKISALGKLSFTSMQCKLVPHWVGGALD